MKAIYKSILPFLAIILLVSCNTEKKLKKTEIKTEKEVNKGVTFINKAIQAHGGELYNSASYQFSFRNNQYSFTNTKESYKYTVLRKNKNNEAVLDVLSNTKFSRFINDKETTLSDKDNLRYSEALNSVIYFATLPYKLKDTSVNKNYIGKTTIKNKEYNVVEIYFNKEGGGKDFDDIYYYWINTTTNIIDYFAYNYKVNNGGVRFRSAYNKRNVGGIIFQDYINFKAPVETPLADLPSLFEKNELKEVSRILTENVVNLKK